MRNLLHAVLAMTVATSSLAQNREPKPATIAKPGEITGGVPGVSPPVVLYAPAPVFTGEERKGTISGNVLVYLQVGTDGLPSNVRVLRGLRQDLDVKAVEAVKQYKFKPATRNGIPVRIEMNVQVNFNIY